MYFRQNPYGWDPYTYLGPSYPNYFMHSGISPFPFPAYQQHTGIPNLPYNPTLEKMNPPMFPGQAYSPIPIQPPMNSLISYFHDNEGKLDLNKMLSTVGQVSNTVKQVSPLFKQFSAFLGKV